MFSELNPTYNIILKLNKITSQIINKIIIDKMKPEKWPHVVILSVPGDGRPAELYRFKKNWWEIAKKVPAVVNNALFK